MFSVFVCVRDNIIQTFNSELVGKKEETGTSCSYNMPSSVKEKPSRFFFQLVDKNI
jgi:hypothetical protein